jgi:hypothetical protein
MHYLFALSLVLLSGLANANETEKKEKHHDDPTKVITRVGLGYTDDLTFSGSLALDPARKLNAKTNTDASEWRLGGSWLFDFGIMNFSLSRSEYDDGGHKNNYSIGTFLPLSALGVDTGKWMIFPMAGINHNEGETAVNDDTQLEDGVVMVQNTNNGGYLGGMALRPITDHWTILAFGGGGMGSGGYSNVWLGSGISYKLNTHHSLNLFGFVSDDDFGRISKLGLTYTYEFK